MATLTFFVGPAAAGKTTLAKRLAAKRRSAFFDMDTLLRPAAEKIMELSGLDPADRDSAEYKVRCRDLGYRITMDAALENIALGIDAVVVGPFTQETEDPGWIGKELERIGASLSAVEVRAVYVYLPAEEDYAERLRGRGSPLDEWKLEHWDDFRRSLRRREIRWAIPASSVLRFDNSAPLTDGRLAELEHFVYGRPSGGELERHP
ncbi:MULTISPECIES: AAA family ATPase [Paenibacillus]|uniref:AAA family ATPase n=1 Tax=Paenibacillus TaxID=44249 RepID=UPI0022B8B3A5|nr:AAA family ATPase [Paenibacillus caseinilyticus]MCZ8521988.1 AAA family ATPase [Paenibacillus caseinilyticus]